ncbi:LysR family transcriptional regulator [Liquorilactobacillus oeni]|uniref:Transcriptional regulator n=1 Tax=Liquorilactobacillus oeni DSM 19972 TaxID=1423777 RepID=A0A0R1MAZ3_9LACO|nr:LysR family transcriptional regulator [Liquorilactobacillus oeni]KRL05190.1 transcriptional regulator [Liquorilactobacillus oeni DSM 19972]
MLNQPYLTFLVLTQTLSYTKTAQQLFVTQPAVSQQIQHLEKELGLKLVEYHRPHLTITSAGYQLADFLQKTSVQAKQLLQQLQTPKKAKKITFSATLSLSEFLVPEMIKKMSLNSEFVNINCLVGNTQQSLTAIRKGRSQFALIEGNFDKNKFDYQVIRSEPFSAVVSKYHPLARRKNLTWEELLHVPLIVRESGSGSREILTSLAYAENISLHDFDQLITVSEPVLIRQLLLQNVGVSFLYHSLITTQLNNGELVELNLTNAQTTHDLYLVYPKGSYFKKSYERWLY